MRKILLLADNNANFRETYGKVLSDAGYDVKLASDPKQARNLLWETAIDLAILDIRLMPESEPGNESVNDISGLEIATDKTFRHIPKIILTAYPSYEYAREALGLTPDGLPPAVNFLDKGEGSQALLQAIEKAFEQHVRVDDRLDIVFTEPPSFQRWVRQIMGSDLSDAELDNRVKELEKLFRKAFRDYTEAGLEPVPMMRQGQVLARVRLRQKDTQIPLRIARCGQRETIMEEQMAYRDRDKGQLVREWAVRQEDVQESVNFGIIVYSASGFDLERAQWLADYFKLLTPKEVISALNNLFGRAWESLYKQPCPAKQDKTLNLLYKERLSLTEEHCAEETFQESLQETIQYMQSRYMARVETETGGQRLVLSFPDGSQLSCPHPTLYFYRDGRVLEPPVFCRRSLGCMDGYSILIDREGKAWVTDFSAIGPAPAPSDFVALEARIRFEWIHVSDLDQLREFEALLTTPGPLEELLEIKILGEKDLDKALAVIAHLRTLAARVPGVGSQAYQLGLFFEAASILASDAPLDRKAHALLAAAMVCRALERCEEFEKA